MARKKCVEMLSYWCSLGRACITENMICADPSNGNTCKGDSGGTINSTKKLFETPGLHF